MLNLTVWERLVLRGILAQIPGLTLAAIEQGLPIMAKLALTEEEKRDQRFAESGGVAIWQDQEKTYPIDLTEDQIRFLAQAATGAETRGYPMDPRSIQLKAKIINAVQMEVRDGIQP